MRLREILTETQIVNIDQQIGATQSASDFLRYIARDVAIAGWMLSKARKWLLKSYQGPALLPVNPRARVYQDIPWIQKAAVEGQPIFAFAWDRDPALEQKIRSIRDWLAYLKHNEPREFAKIDRISFEQASVAEQRWHAEMARRAEKNKTQVVGTDGVEPALKVGDLKWVKLTSAAALKAEGDFMGHCVGGYCDEVEGGSTLIYSLRDAKNVAHATVEFSFSVTDEEGWPIAPQAYVEQIKGKGNSQIAERYRMAVVALVKHLEAKWTPEGLTDFDKEGGFWLLDHHLAKFDDVAKKVYDRDGVEVFCLTSKPMRRGRSELRVDGQPALIANLGQQGGDRWYVLDLEHPAGVGDERLPQLWKIFQVSGVRSMDLSHIAWRQLAQMMHAAGQTIKVPDWAKPRAAE